jgi:hypothetical protein
MVALLVCICTDIQHLVSVSFSWKGQPTLMGPISNCVTWYSDALCASQDTAAPQQMLILVGRFTKADNILRTPHDTEACQPANNGLLCRLRMQNTTLWKLTANAKRVLHKSDFQAPVAIPLQAWVCEAQ